MDSVAPVGQDGAPTSAEGSGCRGVAARLLLGAVLVAGVMGGVVLAVHAVGGNGAALDRSPVTQAAALDALRAAPLPDLSTCESDLEALMADTASIGTDPLSSGTLGPDAQQTHNDCQTLAGQVAQMNVGADALAADARQELGIALDDAVRGAARASDAAYDIDGSAYQQATSALNDATSSFTSAHQHLRAVGADIGVDVG